MNMILDRSNDQNSTNAKTVSKSPQKQIKSQYSNSYQRRSNSMAVNPLENNIGKLLNSNVQRDPQKIIFHPRYDENERIFYRSRFSESEETQCLHKIIDKCTK